MKRIIQHSLLCLLMISTGISFMTSCSVETEERKDHSTINSDVTIRFGIGSAADDTRATTTEDGWQDWNENKITRLNLLVFKVGVPTKNIDLVPGITVNDYDDVLNKVVHTIDIPRTVLTKNEVTGASVYLIANASENVLSNDFTGTEEDLKSKIITRLDFNEKQSSFIMDAKGTMEQTGSNTILKFDLVRALAKIRLGFNSNTDINDVSCKFMNYATNAKLVAGDEVLPTDIRLMQEDDYNTNYLKWPDGNVNKIVFYSYPNEWYDSEKDPKVEEPIDESKQTYIMILAPYQGKEYYYKIPVNKRLPEDNDRVDLKPEDFKDLYQLKRNHIYDITVNIDREGGTKEEPVELTLQYKVIDWEGERGGDIIFE